MADKRFTVVINGDGGYSSYQVKAPDWKVAEEKGRETHKENYPDELDFEIGCAAVVAGWPDVWVG